LQETFLPERTSLRLVKMVYCPSCDEVFLKSRIERNLCPNCEGRARSVSVGLSWQYVVSAIVLIAGAGFIFVLNDQDMMMRLIIFIMFAVLAFSLSSWGVEAQKMKALELARKERDEE
ncbi:MAG: hypothetical protein ACE5IJ_12400, partial [Thermoplasmata archaeon]